MLLELEKSSGIRSLGNLFTKYYLGKRKVVKPAKLLGPLCLCDSWASEIQAFADERDSNGNVASHRKFQLRAGNLLRYAINHPVAASSMRIQSLMVITYY